MNALVDWENGSVSRDVFVSPEVYRRELETVFARAWLFVGHECQIPKPGDFFTSRMGEESVILTRDRDGQVHVLLNSCRHRGMKVCRYDSGNTTVFTCPYHAWSYATDGRLVGVPMYKTLYEGKLDRSEWSLVPVAKLALYKGTVWATWDPNAPEFLDYLGDAKAHLDLALDCRDGRNGGSEVIGVQKWIVPANWKLAAENFLGDTYHNPSHRSVDMIGIGPSAKAGVKGRRDNEMELAQHIWCSFPAGHGVHSAVMPKPNHYQSVYGDDPEVEAYFRDCHAERERRLGDRARLIPFVGTIFPNASFHGRQPRNICVWHPHSATEIEAWRFFLVDADAPTKIKDYLRDYYMRYSGPAGMTEQDDMENWLYATNASRGAIARRYAFNYMQSMGASQINPSVDGLEVRGDVSQQVTEHMALGFYRRWSDYLSDADWPTLMGGGDERFAAPASRMRDAAR